MNKSVKLAGLLLMIAAATTHAVPITVDFETEDDFVPGPATPLINGQLLDTEFGNLFGISTTVTGGGSGHLGAAIFDSTPAGPNAGSGDPDLLVGLGNILILQADESPASHLDPTYGDVFDFPNDEADHADAGSIIFSFVSPVDLVSLDLVDINGSAHVTVTLSDSLGRNRVFDVPEKWTKDISVAGPAGYQALDLDTLAPQPAEPGAAGADATAFEDAGFDPADIVTLEVNIMGSGGIDNLVFVPEPSAVLLLAFGAVPLLRRRR